MNDTKIRIIFDIDKYKMSKTEKYRKNRGGDSKTERRRKTEKRRRTEKYRRRDTDVMKKVRYDDIMRRTY
jgi:hypothetical protein